MLSSEEKQFVEAVAVTNKFGLIAHAVALTRLLNGILGPDHAHLSVLEVFNEMSTASLEVNECIREIKS